MRAAGHRLLPHESRFAGMAQRRQGREPNAAIVRGQQNYGPDGMLLMSATIIDSLIGSLLFFAGLVIALGFGEKSLGAVPLSLLGLGALSALVGLVRAVQCGRVGKAYRAGQPFIKPTRR